MIAPVTLSTKKWPTPVTDTTLDFTTLFLQEIDQYLQRYPYTQYVDIYLHDLNGHRRGKRIDVACLKSLRTGCYFPLSVYAMSLDGQVIEDTGLGYANGEPDYLCLPLLGTLQPSAFNPEKHAQVLLTMQDGHQGCPFEPRNILKKIVQQLHRLDFYPCIAAELEFYLEPIQKDSSHSVALTQCFDIDPPRQDQHVLDEINHIAAEQGIHITGIVAESSSGQYEINLQHQHAVLQLCDQLMLLKRTIKQVATKHGFQASFLAKPNLQKAGSGMHFHMSLAHLEQKNIFSSTSSDQCSETLLKVISGLIALLPASVAILAPNVNSFRRFSQGHHVPLAATWGVNNRHVAIRIPCSDQDNQRLEYRVAGADCNPYLAVAMILTGTLHGLTQDLEIPQAFTSPTLSKDDVLFATNQLDALAQLKSDPVLAHYIGADFIRLWCAVKYAEHCDLFKQMTSMEQAWDL